MQFEWDEQKNLLNQQKHGLGFEEATKVFDDANRVDVPDLRRDYGEPRWMAIGKMVGQIVSVIFTMRETVFRLISARPSSREEREKYHGQ